MPSPNHSRSSSRNVAQNSAQNPSVDKNWSKCTCTRRARSANEDAWAAVIASWIICSRNSYPGPKRVVSATRSGRVSIVFCNSGEKDFCWVFSTRKIVVSDPGLFASSWRRIGCKATTIRTTFAKNAVSRVSTAASAPVGLVRHVDQAYPRDGDPDARKHARQQRRSFRARRRRLAVDSDRAHVPYDSERRSHLHD